MGLNTNLANFIVSLDAATMPPEVMVKARNCLLYSYGIALGSHTTPYASVARHAALAMDGAVSELGATLFADGRKTTVAGAVLANAALFHGRAQDDTCGTAHLGAILVPLLTAMTESHKYSTSRLLPALIAGYETGGLLENAYASLTTPAGLRASPLYGSIAAAAGASKLMGLCVEKTAAALSNAASFAGGMLQSFDDGSDEWRYQLGMAAQQGYVAAQLARAGSASAARAFEGPSGFVQTFARTTCDVSELASRLGVDWSIHRVTFKPYPVCAFNQTPVTAALAVRAKLGNSKILRVRVRMNPYETGYAGMDSKGPFNSLSGTLMSIPFCIANTLVRGAPTMKTMTVYDDAPVNDLVQRIDLVADSGIARLCCVVEAELDGADSVIHEQRMSTHDYAYDRATVAALIRQVGGESGVPQSCYRRLESFVDNLETSDIAEVLACFDALPQSASEPANG